MVRPARIDQFDCLREVADGLEVFREVVRFGRALGRAEAEVEVRLRKVREE
jgi:hypothetical protein